MSRRRDQKLYTCYPVGYVALYDGLTVVHFLLGGLALLVAYPWRVGTPLAAAYIFFAFLEMFLLMPLTVCPACVYYRIDGSLCASGMNRWSRRIAKPRESARFGERANGLLCPNNLYLVSLAFPIVAVIPGLVLDYSGPLLVAVLVLVGLLAFRFFVVFPYFACGRCRAKNVCPNARSMGLSDAGQPGAIVAESFRELPRS